MKIAFLKLLDASVGRLLSSLCFVLKKRSTLPENLQAALFIRPGGIGDATLLAPAVNVFKRRFPGCRVDVLAEKRNSKVFDLCPGVSQVFCYDQLADWIQLWKRQYDVIIDTEQWYRLSAVIGRLIGGQFLVGFGTNNRRRLLNRVIIYDLDRYEASSFLSLLPPWEGDLSEEIEGPFLSLVGGGRERIDALLATRPASPCVALCPGGSRPEKSWGEARYVELARQLAGNGIFTVVLGGPDDVSVASRIADAAQGLCLAGRTSLVESAIALQECDVVVANDTGLLHLAAGLGTSTVGIFGPSNPMKWAPHGAGHRVLWNKLDCAPCARYGNISDCPRGVRCLSEISCDDVMDAVLSLLPLVSHRNYNPGEGVVLQ